MRGYLRIGARGWLVLFSAGLVGAAGACSQSDFVADNGDGGTDSGGGDDFTVNGGDTGSDPETGRDTGGGGTDAVADVINAPDGDAGTIDDTPIIHPDADSGCGAVPSDTLGSSVAIGGTGDPAAGCTAANPCGTIANGILSARKHSHSFVYVSDGIYNEQVLLDASTLQSLTAGLRIQGGWHRDPSSHAWQNCSLAVVDIVGPAGSVGTVVMNNPPGPVTLDTVKISSRPSVQGVGDSVYGIIVSGTSSNLTLDSVVVDAKPAGSGPAGSAGGGGAAAPGSCAAGGTTAPPGGSGAAGQLGSFGPNGYTPLTAGTGTAGGQGANGVVGTGTNGTPGPVCNTKCFDRVACIADVACGNPHEKTVCGNPGIPGCGSGGGGPGTGGGGGGSSVAVYVWTGATVTANYTTVSGYNGGNGGNGGGGGTTPAGSAGQTGAPVSCNINESCTFMPPPNDSSCTTQGGTPVSQAGGQATNGAAGSPGGAGGGGAGGYSYGYYKGPGATVNEGPGFTAASKGAPGTGGTGGNPGVPGLSGAHN